MLKQQNGKCEFCNASFKHGDKMETHHHIRVVDGGSTKHNNLVLLHLHYNDQYHAKFAKIKHEELSSTDKDYMGGAV